LKLKHYCLKKLKLLKKGEKCDICVKNETKRKPTKYCDEHECYYYGKECRDCKRNRTRKEQRVKVKKERKKEKQFKKDKLKKA